MFVTLGLADGDPSPEQLKVSLILPAITIGYTIVMTCKNKSSHEHEHNTHGRNE